MSFGHRPHGPVDPNAPIRVRAPRPGEIIGIVTEMTGGARMRVQCSDGKDRMCRVPGKIRRRIWVRAGDYVIVTPWSVEGDEKGDIAFRYTKVQSEALKSRGLLKM
ncbi:translation initiation factor eIF-1A [Candidatus Micrarchaeota archaeon]|nr:translation initiation factor eIF-1A [Candidatus Micrarchaeota archaeon]